MEGPPVWCRLFFQSAAHQPHPLNYSQQATAVLQALALRYGTHPACLGWGLLNEPNVRANMPLTPCPWPSVREPHLEATVMAVCCAFMDCCVT